MPCNTSAACLYRKAVRIMYVSKHWWCDITRYTGGLFIFRIFRSSRYSFELPYLYTACRVDQLYMPLSISQISLSYKQTDLSTGICACTFNNNAVEYHLLQFHRFSWVLTPIFLSIPVADHFLSSRLLCCHPWWIGPHRTAWHIVVWHRIA